MAQSVLTFHSLLRWLVLALGPVALMGLAWQIRQQRVSPDFLPLRVWVMLFDIQALLGLVLLFFHLRGTAPPASVTDVQFHTLLMVMALALVHWGHIRWKRTAEAPCWCALWPLVLGWLLMLVASPWP